MSCCLMLSVVKRLQRTWDVWHLHVSKIWFISCVPLVWQALSSGWALNYCSHIWIKRHFITQRSHLSSWPQHASDCFTFSFFKYNLQNFQILAFSTYPEQLVPIVSTCHISINLLSYPTVVARIKGKDVLFNISASLHCKVFWLLAFVCHCQFEAWCPPLLRGKCNINSNGASLLN